MLPIARLSFTEDNAVSIMVIVARALLEPVAADTLACAPVIPNAVRLTEIFDIEMVTQLLEALLIPIWNFSALVELRMVILLKFASLEIREISFRSWLDSIWICALSVEEYVSLEDCTASSLILVRIL